MSQKHNKKGGRRVILAGVLLAVSLAVSSCTSDKTPYGISAVEETATGEELKKWSEDSVGIAESLFDDFEVCSVKIDGEWKKGLYNEENELLVTQDGSGETYTVYRGEQSVTVPMGVKFPDENRVAIDLADINEDGKNELYLYGSIDHGVNRLHVIGIEPLALMTDPYDIHSVKEIVPEYSIVSAEVQDGGGALVEAGFVLNDGTSHTLSVSIPDADIDKLDDYAVTPVICNTTAYRDTDGSVQNLGLDVRFRVSQGAGGFHGVVYVFISIPLEYDAAAGRFVPGSDVKIEYKDIEPADWG